MKPHKRLVFVLILIQLLFVSCILDEDLDFHLPQVLEATLVAKAGPDQTIMLPQDSTYVDGSQSTYISAIITSYRWTKVSGPDYFHIRNAAANRTLISDLREGDYQFELKVMDEGGNFSKDTVRVVVVSDETEDTASSPSCTSLGYLPADGFFFGPDYWFNGSDFMMGADNRLFVANNLQSIIREF